jgi:hypothetical protein
LAFRLNGAIRPSHAATRRSLGPATMCHRDRRGVSRQPDCLGRIVNDVARSSACLLQRTVNVEALSLARVISRSLVRVRVGESGLGACAPWITVQCPRGRATVVAPHRRWIPDSHRRCSVSG